MYIYLSSLNRLVRTSQAAAFHRDESPMPTSDMQAFSSFFHFSSSAGFFALDLYEQQDTGLPGHAPTGPSHDGSCRVVSSSAAGG